MNALANDQAERLAALISDDPALSAVTAGLYTGEQSTGGRTRVSADGLITDQALMHDARRHPAHQLQDARPHAAAPRPRRHVAAVAESLQFLVLDEFHPMTARKAPTWQMLLRRLANSQESLECLLESH